jgi:hypothetical protein
MKANDVLMKKWCFGTGRTKARQEGVMNPQGELETYYTYPKYRTIVLKVVEATKKNGQWIVKGKQYSSLNGSPKNVEVVLEEKGTLAKGTWYRAPNQKKPFLKIEGPLMTTEEGMPPVGSLITVNKKHAIVTEVGRNQLTVWVSNKLEKIVCKPGTIKWHSDKILSNAVKDKK